MIMMSDDEGRGESRYNSPSICLLMPFPLFAVHSLVSAARVADVVHVDDVDAATTDDAASSGRHAMSCKHVLP